jgi:peptidoglycan hydrolase-like protein with peptidoglycan-binding domain
MRHAIPSWVRLGTLCLLLWPVVVMAYGDCRVGQAQEQLKEAGLDPGPIDGVLGPRTKAALRHYQASHKNSRNPWTVNTNQAIHSTTPNPEAK